MSKRAILYARVSKDDRAKEGRNLEGQLKMCRDYAREKGWRVVAELAEDDRGARSDKLDLPKLNQIREMAQAGAFDVLVVRELDRLARNLAKQLFVEYELERTGVEVAYVLEEYDDTPEGNFQKNLKATAAEYERLKIKERMVRGQKLAVLGGSVLVYGMPPYGYKVVQKNNKYMLEPDEDEAPVVRMIFRWYAGLDGEQLSTAEIAKRLTEMEIPPSLSSGKRKHDSTKAIINKGVWNPSSVHKILKNEVYIGIWTYRKYHKVDGIAVPSSSEEQITVKVPALIDEETWQSVQSLLQKKGASKRKHQYLLSRRVKCGVCKARMSGWSTTRGGTTYIYYICTQRKSVPEHPYKCNLPSFRCDTVDTAIWEWITSLLTEPTVLRAYLNEQQSIAKNESIPLYNELKRVEHQVSQKHIQQEKLLDLYLNGAISKDNWLRRNISIKSDIETLQQEENILRKQISEETLADTQIQSMTAFAQDVAKGIRAAEQDFTAKRRIIELLDVSVTVSLKDDKQKALVVSTIFGKKELLI
ncbi:recombinase family protein [Chloroflexi bacterium TSY]|nr:recombinase family protein [Chloroflexi bacterium TSY]